jgi:uncharacterized protein YgiM (DUF1202 family)
MKDEQPKSWWKTIPGCLTGLVTGCLTGLAGVITATAGLVVALQQTGILREKDQFNPITSPPPNITSAIPGAAPSSSSQPVLPLPTSTPQRSDLLPGEIKAVINDPDGYTNVRFGQGTSYEIIARINEGEVFYTIPQGNSNWWPVRTFEGKYGYVHRSRIKIQTSN